MRALRDVTRKHRATLSQIANELGATFATTFSDAITHLIHVSDKPNDTLKDFKLAKSAKKAIVHPRWLEDVSERLYYPAIHWVRKLIVSAPQVSEDLQPSRRA